MMQKFDVFIIGSGMAGMTVANKCAKEGLSVGITDELPYGGTCALRGCDPKKVLISASEAADRVHKLQGKGLQGTPNLNWKELMRFKESFTQPVPKQIAQGYQKKGITTFHETARFIGKNELHLGETRIHADKIVVATGAKARKLSIPGEGHALTSTDFLELKTLPESLLFIGGGYIAFEFAHIAARCGAKVHIVHRGKSPLKNFEQDIVQHLVELTKKEGVSITLNTEVTEIKKEGEGFRVLAQQEGQEQSFTTEAVFNSSGRSPSLKELNLEAANISYGEKGIAVNDYLQSKSNPAVYAAGDVADTGLPLTPVAVMEGHLLASNLLKGNNKKADYSAIPTVVFTQPALAGVGLTEAQAKEKGLPYAVSYGTAENWFNAKRLNSAAYAYKIIKDKEKDTILGAHLIGPLAEETINLFTMAMKTGAKVKDMQKMLFSYPTFASDLPHML